AWGCSGVGLGEVDAAHMNPDEIFRKSQEFDQMFGKAREFTEELLRENERLRLKMLEIHKEQQEANTETFDNQISLLQERIEQLENEKRALEEQFQAADNDGRSFMTRYAEVEEQNNNLANLYVASYQLHSTLDFVEVMTTVKEILINLIGAEVFSIMLQDERSGELAVVASQHLNDTLTLRLGEGPIGKAALSGQTYMAPEPAQGGDIDVGAPLAAIPLKIKEHVIGVICIYRLMEQKDKFQNIDYELFTLLASHAATAIFSSQLYSRSERKLSTIQNFLELLTTG
ncbi:MAG: GAF domain-containing protein, partial [Acidobacteriota bacterium]